MDGVTVEHRDGEGRIRGAQMKVIDFDDLNANDWLAVNQLTVTENRNTRRPDVVLFVNGLPPGRHRAEEPGGRGTPPSGPRGTSFRPTRPSYPPCSL